MPIVSAGREDPAVGLFAHGDVVVRHGRRRRRWCARATSASRRARASSWRASTAAASSAALMAPGPADGQRADRHAAGHLHDGVAARPGRQRVADSIGTPNTGSGVIAAVMPGRCAAPPAPATMILKARRPARPWRTRTSRSGVRWAETMSASWPTPSASRVAAACRMVAQSDWLPMMMATGLVATGLVVTGLGVGNPGSWGDTTLSKMAKSVLAEGGAARKPPGGGAHSGVR